MNNIRILGSISPYCKNNCNCPGYLVNRNNYKILLDCGSGITSQMSMPDDLKNLTIVISHYHKDHYSDLFSIGYASFCYHRLGLLNNKIKVYIPEVYVGEIEYYDYQLINNFNEHYFDIETYNCDSKIKIDDNLISFFKVNHSISSYSCKIKNNNYEIVYTGDMGYSNIDNYICFCKNADILISEATYLESDNVVDANHLHVNEAATIAKMANVKLLLLTHFWPEHNKLEYLSEAKTIFKNTVIAEERQIIDLKTLINYKQ